MPFAAALPRGLGLAAALMVMRPSREVQTLRSIGRIVSVFLGALATVAFLRLRPSDLLIGSSAW
jgi:hypothetical protein